ncbi:recombination mediator RecR [Alphaproteobacteria bacterium]|nr:recombination mediator RecR [Alphaproteobacteria bacterium]
MSDDGLQNLIKRLGKLPGLGPRSAQRAALALIKNKEQTMLPLAQALHEVAHRYRPCVQCNNLTELDKCTICNDPRRDARRLCIVEDVSDLWAMERAGVFQGRYFILGGCLNIMDGRGPSELGIDKLVSYVTSISTSEDMCEIILATSATVEGQTTAHYIAERLAGLTITLSRLAHGVPVGGELNYLDDGTLALAMKARTPLTK